MGHLFLNILFLFISLHRVPRLSKALLTDSSKIVLSEMRVQHIMPNTEHTPTISAKCMSKAFLFYTTISAVKTNCSNRPAMVSQVKLANWTS